MLTHPFIETPRLRLRDWQPKDLTPFAAMNQCPDVMAYFPAPLTQVESKKTMYAFQQELAQQGFGLFVCELAATAEFMGFVGLHIPTFETAFTPCVEIGWRLAKQFWGQGYASEAARAVLQFGFEQSKLTEILSFTVPDNQRSRRVMEKIGMRYCPKEDFFHPRLPQEHSLAKHVLYRISYKDYLCLNYPK